MQSPTTGPRMIASTHGVQIALHHFGGNGPRLIISHATGMNAMAYRPMANVLARYFDVWGLDLRGHGGSTPPQDDEFAWTNMADDLLAVIYHFGGDPVRVFGHSMGGTTVLLAEKKRPGIIAGAWLFEPIVFPFDPTAHNSQMAVNAKKRRSEFPSKAEALARYAGRPPLSILRADALSGYVEGGFVETSAGTVELACLPEHEGAVFANAGTNLAAVEGLELRATIAAGRSEEGPSPAEFALATANVLPNATHARYEQLSHFGPLESPDVIAADVAEFLRD